ncbi:MAG: chemotaxis protein CheB [Flavobacteriales bacterium]|nr:chemotaxis protein CheB [Flavobacteriales bacterium]
MQLNKRTRYEALVIGASAGGLKAIREILVPLPQNFSLTILIVQHIAPDAGSVWPTILDKQCRIRVKEADEKETAMPGTVYIAPPNYHLLVETDRTLSLTIDERVCYARPSCDVLFETAADAYRERLVGVVLTGANNDGARGLTKIKEYGGFTIAQSPESAESPYMPLAAIEACQPDLILSPDKISETLMKVHQQSNNHHEFQA